ncbi:MAG: hypothetical protein ACRDNS_00725 [Trebonia sp.]
MGHWWAADKSGERSAGRGRGLLIAVVVCAVAALIAVILVGRHHGGGSASPTLPTPSPRSPVTSPAASPLPGPTAVPTIAPDDTKWSLFNGLALPSSPTAGPSRIDGPVYAGYAHTPDGALFAAAQIGVRYLATPGDGWRQVLAQQVVPGPGVATYTKNREQAGLGDAPTIDTTGTGQFVGFRFLTYTPQVAVLQLVVRFPQNGRYQASTTTLQWVAGDWKLQLLPDGSSASTTQQIATLAGYVAWSGVG